MIEAGSPLARRGWSARAAGVEGGPSGVTTTYFLWDGLRLMETRNADGTLKARLTHGLARIEGIGSGVEIYVPSSGKRYYMLYDHRGSAHALLDESKSVVATRLYSAFGRIISETGTWPDEVPFAYQTNWLAPAGLTLPDGTRLYLAPFRVYDPRTGRFLQRDTCPEIRLLQQQTHGNADGHWVADVSDEGKLGYYFDLASGLARRLGIGVTPSSGELRSLGLGTNPKRYTLDFQGARYEADTGPAVPGTGDYTARVRRWWVRQLPLTLGDLANTYDYVRNDPGLLTDPDGRFIKWFSPPFWLKVVWNLVKLALRGPAEEDPEEARRRAMLEAAPPSEREHIRKAHYIERNIEAGNKQEMQRERTDQPAMNYLSPEHQAIVEGEPVGPEGMPGAVGQTDAGDPCAQ